MKLDEFLSEFEGLAPEERLELLVDFSNLLPPLPANQQQLAEQPSCKINECQTPVYLSCTVQEGKLHFAAVVPEKSPTVRGFVAMLVVGLEGESPAAASQLTPSLLSRTGLNEVLGMTRVRGFSGILERIPEDCPRLSFPPPTALRPSDRNSRFLQLFSHGFTGTSLYC